MTHAIPAGTHLILYDGLCGLCNGLNRFVLRRDRAGVFQFAALQSAAARAILIRYGKDPDNLTTFYVVPDYQSEASTILSKSRAALFVVKTLGGPWRWLGGLGILPTLILDWAYDRVARNRYRLFGRYETCLIPTGKYKGRFIDA